LFQVYYCISPPARVVYVLLQMVDPLAVALGYQFACRFPQPEPRAGAWRLWGLFVWFACVAELLVRAPYWSLWALDPIGRARFHDRIRPLVTLTESRPPLMWKIEAAIFFLSIIAVIVRNYTTVRGEDQRRRVRWVMLGLVAGLVPQLTLYGGSWLCAVTGIGFSVRAPWFRTAEIATLAWVATVTPLAFGYAILRHRVLEIHIVLRQGIRHVLAKRSLQLILALPLALLAARVALHPQLTLAELFFPNAWYLALVAAAVAGLRYRQRLATAVDRRFFREAYDQEQILLALVESLNEQESISEIARLVSARIDSALHPKSIVALHRDDEHADFAVSHSSSSDCVLERLPAGSGLPRMLAGSARAREYPLARMHELAADERAALDALGVRLIVPIRGRDLRLAGLILLGEKRSEARYSGTDRQLLETIAAQIGIVYENIRLRDSAARAERVRTEVLAHLAGTGVALLRECPRCGHCGQTEGERCPRDGAALELTLPVERTLGGRYQLEQRVGHGGMGAVYRATDQRLSRTVAVKVMFGALFGNRTAQRRFEREAAAAARLNHPHIATLHDYGRLGGGGAFLVMEYVSGVTLRQAWELNPASLSSWFDQLIDALDAAHAAGVIHRDLKPENVLIAAGDTVKVVDFGLARLCDQEELEPSRLTVAGGVVGTAGYMSPEQMTGGPITPAADLFSLAVMVFEALTGARPYPGRHYAEVLAAVQRGPAHLALVSAEWAELDALLGRALSREPAARPALAELRQALARLLPACPPVTRRGGVDQDASTVDYRGPGQTLS
jgi:hypothetical protein